uniref:Expansin-like EG45 domain-containing protein n=1 Tax=Globisporangium ultimum (strain ATCC 200006 / CBS 805.95 / DAOM BR144) TaxID=431595 RepID=K3W699_GLOUD
MQRIAFLRALLAAVAATQAVRASADFFEGEGTTYTLSEPNNGNCNFMAYPDTAVTKYAALNEKQWDATINCGRCAEVMCTDARCKGSVSSEIVHIVDQCPGCEYGDLDLAPTVFEGITGFTSDRLKIKWRFVDCPITSNIKYCLKKGSNAFWTAIQPTNFVAGIASLKVNDRETTMVDSAYYFLLDGKSESKTDLSNLKITITAVNGQVTEDTVSFATSDCVEGKSQIKAGNPTSPKDQQQSQHSSNSRRKKQRQYHRQNHRQCQRL